MATPASDMPALPDSILAAAMGRAAVLPVTFRAETSSIRELGEVEPTVAWWTSIRAAEDEGGSDPGPGVEIASAHGTLIRVSPLYANRFHEAAAENSDLAEAAGDVDEHFDELEEMGAIVDVFYLDHVEVIPEVRGHRWGARVAANLLQAVCVDNVDRLIVAFAGKAADAADSPNRLAAQRILTDLAMERLDGTDLYVGHPSCAGFAEAIAAWLGAPGTVAS